ncbi:hypothetical protein [Sphingomonas sp.]|jgi:hypothetical protein|uniref:hypothetical protein n=1 Tax=Sphingomonas sp. TaxID=28214 RepID=UPI002E34ACCF|nr:hypothetical protein [Sphingomonas sp.]HEX4695696.1 hypothetical protein [Sphingomonas sp.]
MQFVETIIRRDPWEVEPRLLELNLTSAGLRRIRNVALAARNNVTDFHAANAPGTFAYQDGVWCLRDEFVGDIWKRERPGGVEAIVSHQNEIRVAFANVDRCCDINHDPAPISEKGAGAERLCETNLFERLPTFTKQQSSLGIPLFYCMVDPEGRVELSRPTIEGKSFGPCVERNFISNGGDDDDGGKLSINPRDDGAVEITPTITRRAA